MSLKTSLLAHYHYPHLTDVEQIIAEKKPHRLSQDRFWDLLYAEAIECDTPPEDAKCLTNRICREFHYRFLKDALRRGEDLPNWVWKSLHKDDAEKLSVIHNKNLRKKHRMAYNKRKRRIMAAIRTSIHVRLKGKVKKVSICRDILDYNVEELMAHLEAQFKPGMSWDNYGEWHIDHIKPVAAFNIQSYDDPALKECWALSNLQPLWARENMLKGAKYEEAI